MTLTSLDLSMFDPRERCFREDLADARRLLGAARKRKGALSGCLARCKTASTTQARDETAHERVDLPYFHIRPCPRPAARTGQWLESGAAEAHRVVHPDPPLIREAEEGSFGLKGYVCAPLFSEMEPPNQCVRNF
jgi:hypothetical protein